MRSSFYGLNVAARGLFVSQKNLDVVNHNLNNVNTPGFSRQSTVQTAAKPMALLDGTGMMGQGADISAVVRMRDEYLDYKYWSENVSDGEWQAKNEMLADMQAAFNEPSDSGFSQVTDDFFKTLQELQKDPSSLSVRAVVSEKGVAMARYFNNLATHFEELQADVNYRIMTKVSEINSIGGQIESLNRDIYMSELDGSNANDLRDERATLVDKLSKIINVEAQEVVVGKSASGKEDKHFVVTISGKPFVDHFSASSKVDTALSKLSVTQRTTKLNAEDIDGLYEVGWADGNKLTVKGGELKGYLDVRDGNDAQNGSPLFNGIPYYQRKLNQYVRTFAMAFNEGYIYNSNTKMMDDGQGHADGYRMDSQEGDQVSGIRFFTMLGTDKHPVSSSDFIGTASTVTPDAARIDAIVAQYGNMTAKNFSVSSDIIDDYKNISTTDTAGQNGNTGTIDALIAFRDNIHMFSEGKPEDFMKAQLSTVGIDAQQTKRVTDNQDAILKQIENRRQSYSGVSIDEEMANMVRYQHTYSASAKMISTLSEVYDTLVNRLGVG